MPLAPPKRRTGLWVAVVVIVVAILAIAAVGYAMGWFSGSKSSGCSTSQTLTGAGSTFVFPLMNDWAITYANTGCAMVNYQAIGSGGGINQLTQKTVDFGASDAPLNPTQRAALPGPVLTIPDTIGGVVVIFNLAGIKNLNFTGSVLAQIYLGNITTWNNTAITSINPGVTLPNEAISAVHRADPSGTTFVWTSYLSKESTYWAAHVGAATSVNWPPAPGGTGAKGSTGVAGQVGSTAGAIGYVEFTYANLNSLSYAGVQNPVGTYVKPTVANIGAAASAVTSLPAGNGDWGNVSLLNEPGTGTYPLVTFSYIMVYSDLSAVYGSALTQAQAKALVDFLHWTVTTGQTYSAGLFYVPLPSNVVSLDQTTVGEILYNGANPS